MPEQKLAGGVETAVVASAEQAERPLEDVAAQHAAEMDAVQAEHGAEMSKEARCAQIGEALLTLATTDPDGEQYLAEYLEHTAFPDGTNECLLNFENEKRTGDPAYDVTQEQPRRLAFVLKRGLQATEEVTEVKQEAELAVDEQAEADETEGAWATVSVSPEYQNANNADKIAILLRTDGLPEEIKARVQAFSQILAIADRVPADAPVVRQRINQLDLSQGVPDPVQFACSFLFDGPDSHLKSGVSDATQDAIAAELGIVRNEFNAATGGDINDIYKNGVGTKLVRDPETGELREEPMYLEPGQDVEIRKNQFVGLSDTNEPVMKIVGEHTYTADLPDNPSDHDMTMYGMTTQWIAKLNDVNMAEMFFPHSVMERGGGHIELNMPDDFNRAQRLSQAFFGAMAGYNGELLDQSDLDRIPYLMQFQNEKGDAVIGDVNPDQMRADYRRQGVVNKDDTLNWDRFAAMIETNRNGLYTSEQNYGQTAQAEAA